MTRRSASPGPGSHRGPSPGRSASRTGRSTTGCARRGSSSAVGTGCARSIEPRRRRRHFKAYDARGRDRQRLVDTFPGLIRSRHITFAPRLAHQAEMNRALNSYRREVLDDGSVGAALAVALFLAVTTTPRVVPRIG